MIHFANCRTRSNFSTNIDKVAGIFEKNRETEKVITEITTADEQQSRDKL